MIMLPAARCKEVKKLVKIVGRGKWSDIIDKIEEFESNYK